MILSCIKWKGQNFRKNHMIRKSTLLFKGWIYLIVNKLQTIITIFFIFTTIKCTFLKWRHKEWELRSILFLSEFGFTTHYTCKHGKLMETFQCKKKKILQQRMQLPWIWLIDWSSQNKPETFSIELLKISNPLID